MTKKLHCGLSVDDARRVVEHASASASYWQVSSSRFYGTYEGGGVIYRGGQWDRTPHLATEMEENPDFIKLSDLRTELAEYEAMLTHDGDYVHSQKSQAHNKNYAQNRKLRVYGTADTDYNPESQPFLIKFDDGMREDIWLKCSEAEAITHWENFSIQWNCYLFELKKVEKEQAND